MARPSPAARQCGGAPIPRAVETQRSTPGLLATMLPAAGLLAVTIAVYAPAAHFDFINLDDGLYVTANRRVQAGLSWQGIVWAFTTRYASHWHPLTWLSHMADCQLFGLDAGSHHAVSVAFHSGNTLLLLLALRALTGALWRSTLVAAVFALHPLHVESVAWVAERKDLLSTSASLVALWAYACHARRPGWRRLAIVAIAFAAGLLAKPMVVTLPFVLLLLDWWPLDRARTTKPAALVTEKLPLFVLAAAVSTLTFVVAANTGSVASLDVFPFPARLANALVAYCRYVGKALWPVRLAIFYPVPPSWPPVEVLAATLVLVGITGSTLVARRRHPYLVVGWLWFVGTLVPVIDIVQAGDQAMADRFTYVPLVGLAIATVWGLDALARRRPTATRIAQAGALAVLGALAIATHRQLATWRDSTTVFTHALAVTADNWLAHHNLGMALAKRGDIDSAAGEFAAAIRLRPSYADAHYDLGVALLRERKPDEAVAEFTRTLDLAPHHADAHQALGNLLVQRGLTADGLVHLSDAVRFDPADASKHYNRGVALLQNGGTADAMAEFTEAVRLQPDLAEAHGNLAIIHARQLRLKPELVGRLPRLAP